MSDSVINTSFSGFMFPNETIVQQQFSDMEIIPSNGFNTIARAKRYGRWWILKGLKNEFQGQYAYQCLLQKEFDILISMQHPSIVACTGLEHVDSLGQCIIMEWIDGVSLKEWLQQRHSRQERRNIALQLLDAFDYIHGKQTAHRDLKPSNIIITRNGSNVKVIDFGLSDTDDFAIFKQPAGTLEYISPEQQTANITDIRNDIYSLGCIFDELKLGLCYNKIIKRCKAPVNQRYRNVFEINRSIRRINKLIKTIPILISITIIATLLGYGNYCNSSLTTAIGEKQDSLIELVKDNASLRQKIDTLSIKLETATDKLNEVSEKEVLINHFIENGKRMMSRLEPKDWQKISTYEEMSKVYIDFAQKLNTEITKYVDNLNSISLVEKENIRHVLYTHYSTLITPMSNHLQQLLNETI